MGQRLVIANYTTESEPTNAIYYHWSAYTDSALEELDDLKIMLIMEYHRFVINWLGNANVINCANFQCLLLTYIYA